MVPWGAGFAYEALNNAGHTGRDFTVVLNDNDMSIGPAVGAMNKYLTGMITNPAYNKVRALVKEALHRVPTSFGQLMEEVAGKLEESMKAYADSGDDLPGARLPLRWAGRRPRSGCARRGRSAECAIWMVRFWFMSSRARARVSTSRKRIPGRGMRRAPSTRSRGAEGRSCPPRRPLRATRKFSATGSRNWPPRTPRSSRSPLPCRTAPARTFFGMPTQTASST